MRRIKKLYNTTGECGHIMGMSCSKDNAFVQSHMERE